MHELAEWLSRAELTRGLRWQDGLDIAVLTVLFSMIYRWLRHTVAIQVAFGLVTLVIVSWIAKYTGLVLTSYLLSTVGAVAAIAIIVVFQREIRRALTRVNPTQWLRPATAIGAKDISGIVARAAFAIANHRKGALIVLERRDSIEDQLTGGTPVDARPTAALVEAIFTSLSPLHDGAVLIRDGRLVRAGVVLPLLTDTDDVDRGTRHRAAMGLARVADAVVVCVSEERGEVMLAYEDTFRGFPDETDLRLALDELLGTALGTPASGVALRGRRRRTFRIVPHLVIFAAVLTTWAALMLDRSHAVSRIVPLEIRGIGDDLVFDLPRYNTVVVELRSSERALEMLEPDAVTAYVDLSGSTAGPHVFSVRTSVPAGIEVVSTRPSSVQLLLRPRAPSSPNGQWPPGPPSATAAPSWNLGPVRGAPPLR